MVFDQMAFGQLPEPFREVPRDFKGLSESFRRGFRGVFEHFRDFKAFEEISEGL